MYEYVQTATGWVLFWGGESLYREADRAIVVVAPVSTGPMAAGGMISDQLAAPASSS